MASKVSMLFCADGHHSTDDVQRLRSAPGPSPAGMGVAAEPMTNGSTPSAAPASTPQATTAAATEDDDMTDAAAPPSRTDSHTDSHGDGAQRVEQDTQEGLWL